MLVVAVIDGLTQHVVLVILSSLGTTVVPDSQLLSYSASYTMPSTLKHSSGPMMWCVDEAAGGYI